MILVILGVSILVLIVSSIISECAKSNIDELFEAISFISAFLTGIAIVVLVILIFANAWGTTLEEKIAMYQEENAVIEQQMSDLVVTYMEYEGNTFKACSNESAITLVSLYPELKSDSLVERQMEVYVENNKKIKKLKESLINRGVVKWWLYLGND